MLRYLLRFHQRPGFRCKTILNFRQFNLYRKEQKYIVTVVAFVFAFSWKDKNRYIGKIRGWILHLHFTHVRTTNVIFDSVQWKLNKQMPKYLMPRWCSWCRPYVRVLNVLFRVFFFIISGLVSFTMKMSSSLIFLYVGTNQSRNLFDFVGMLFKLFKHEQINGIRFIVRELGCMDSSEKLSSAHTFKSNDWKLMRYFLLRLTESVNSPYLCLTINWIVQFTFAFSLFESSAIW